MTFLPRNPITVRQMLAFASAIVGTLVEGLAVAEPEGSVAIAWVAPKECPSRDEVRALTAARVPPGTQVAARGVVTRVAGHYKLVLEIESKGERVLEAPSCEALATSAAVVLAMSVAPERHADHEPESVPLSPPALTQEEPRTERSSDTPPAPHGRFRPSFGVRLQAAVDVGTLPATGAGLGLGLGVDPLSMLHVEATANVWLPADGAVAGAPTHGARFGLVTAGMRGCWVLTRPVTVAPCLGADVLVISATGFGTRQVRDVTSVAVAPQLAVLVGVPLGRHLALRGGIGASVPTARQRFAIAAGIVPDVMREQVHRLSSVIVEGWLGPELIF